MKNAGLVPKAAACRPILPCDYNDFYDNPQCLDSIDCPVVDRNTLVRSDAPTRKPVGGVDLSSQRAIPAGWDSIPDPHPSGGLILKSSSVGMLFKHAKEVLVEGGGIEQLMIELCCSEESTLAGAVPPRAAAIRVPEGLDLRQIRTSRVLKDIAKLAVKANISVCLRVAIPCTAVQVLSVQSHNIV